MVSFRLGKRSRVSYGNLEHGWRVDVLRRFDGRKSARSRSEDGEALLAQHEYVGADGRYDPVWFVFRTCLSAILPASRFASSREASTKRNLQRRNVFKVTI